MEILNEHYVTAWVLEHPAHFQLLAPFIRNGSVDDLLIITKTIESMNIYNNSQNYLLVLNQFQVMKLQFLSLDLN